MKPKEAKEYLMRLVREYLARGDGDFWSIFPDLDALRDDFVSFVQNYNPDRRE